MESVNNSVEHKWRQVLAGTNGFPILQSRRCVKNRQYNTHRKYKTERLTSGGGAHKNNRE